MAGLGTINVNLEPTEELRAFIRAIVRQELASALEEISSHKDEAPKSAGIVLMHENDPTREIITLPKGSTIVPPVEKKTGNRSGVAKRKR